MKTKFKNVEDDFYAFTAKTSELTRQYALVGIGIIWILKQGSEKDFKLLPETIPVLQLFLLCLICDFCHAFFPSITYGYLKRKLRKEGNKEDIDVEYSRGWEFPEWLFFIVKIFFLIYAYIELWNIR